MRARRTWTAAIDFNKVSRATERLILNTSVEGERRGIAEPVRQQPVECIRDAAKMWLSRRPLSSAIAMAGMCESVAHIRTQKIGLPDELRHIR